MTDGAASGVRSLTSRPVPGTLDLLKIRLNGEPFELTAPLTVAELLAHLDIDPRRVAVERNIEVVKKQVYESTTVQEGDEIEIVNFVGGGDM